MNSKLSMPTLIALALLIATAILIGFGPAQSTRAESRSGGPAGFNSQAVVLLAWDAGGGGTTGYRISRRTLGANPGDFTLIADVGTVTEYLDRTVEPDTRYSYRINLITDGGTSDTFNLSNIHVAPRMERPIIVPAHPTGISVVSNSQESVRIGWSDPGDPSITGYQILRRKPADEDGFTVIADNHGDADTLGYTDGTVEAGTRFTYRIKARNPNGISERSTWLHVDTPAIPVLLPMIEASEDDRDTVSAGAQHTCGVKDDSTIECWGRNHSGQLAPPNRFARLDLGEYHSCGLRPHGAIECWGDDEHGKTAAPEGMSFTDISAGKNAACGVKTDGSVRCWGYNINTQGTQDRLTPPSPNTGYQAVSNGNQHTCGLKTDGSVVCWGKDPSGDVPTPPDETFTSISAGSTHICGVTDDGSVKCWGSNGHGKSDPPEGDFTSVSAGNSHTCGVRTNGAISCWGNDADGRSTPLTQGNSRAWRSGTNFPAA